MEDLTKYNINLALPILEEYYKYEKILNKTFTHFVSSIGLDEAYENDMRENKK